MLCNQIQYKDVLGSKRPLAGCGIDQNYRFWPLDHGFKSLTG